MQSARALLYPTTWGVGTKGTNYIHNGGTWISEFLGRRDDGLACDSMASLTLASGLLQVFLCFPRFLRSELVTTDIN